MLICSHNQYLVLSFFSFLLSFFFIRLTSPHLLSSPSSPNPVFFLQLLLHKANFELRAFYSAQNINLSSSSVITLSSNAAALFFFKGGFFFSLFIYRFSLHSFPPPSSSLLPTYFLSVFSPSLCALSEMFIFFSFFLNPFAFFHIILSCGLMFSLSRKYNIISLSFPSGWSFHAHPQTAHHM